MSEISPEDLRTLLLENADLAERLERAEARAQGPVLTPEEAAELVLRLLERLNSQLQGLTICDGELRLNVALGENGTKGLAG
ncbi:MAG TPA: hypothetical protein VFX35_10745 [Solirubrobacterales bacterium]|nr:hypothetical protein [Solirubrobacterales bacterium]